MEKKQIRDISIVVCAVVAILNVFQACFLTGLVWAITDFAEKSYYVSVMNGNFIVIFMMAWLIVNLIDVIK